MRLWLIDDDDIYKFATSRGIKSEFTEATVEAFNDGEEALFHLQDVLTDSHKIPDIVLLDINMPIMNGWEFLEAYVNHAPKMEKQPRIYMVTSSVNDWDMEKAEANEFLTGYVSKPLSRESIRNLVTNNK